MHSHGFDSLNSVKILETWRQDCLAGLEFIFNNAINQEHARSKEQQQKHNACTRAQQYIKKLF